MAQAATCIIARRRDIKPNVEALCGFPPTFKFEPDFPIVVTATGIFWPVDPDEIAACKAELAGREAL